MNRTEKTEYDRRGYSIESLTKHLASARKERDILSRMVEILCDRIGLTDDERDIVKKEAMKE